MKKIFFVLICLLGMQAFSQDKVIKKHLVDSQTLVGLWQLVGELKLGDAVTYVPMFSFKLVNEDGTFMTFRVSEKIPTVITAYGTYKIEEGGKFSEYIVSSLHSPIKGTTSKLEYELDKNNLVLSIRYKLADRDNWQTEKWVRVSHKLKGDKDKNMGNVPDIF